MARDEAGQRERHAALGPTVARLCELVERGDVIAVVGSEARGEAIARAVAALTSALVLWCPPPDSLPGEDAPASPAVLGQRVAALSALHARGDRHVLFVTEATAAARKVAAPKAFAGKPLVLAVGDAVDGQALAEQLETIGYFPDDRIDEPGEMAVRAATIDVFPADADQPVRIHLDEGRIDQIGRYDPVSQLGTGDALDQVTLGPVTEPPPGADAVSLFDHLPGAAVALDPEAEERRSRFVELARRQAARRM
jgi:transcription-repair coupling factor (superfamily II helicase)